VKEIFIHSYPVLIGRNLISLETIKPYIKDRQCAIITDTNVAPLYSQTLPSSHLFTIPHGEKSKTREMKAEIEDQMQQKGLGRDTCVIAMGGGMITDLAGFVASTYCRGVPLISIPTSLLAMVDASIGGKTGVNTPLGKNLIGTIYHPEIVIMDTTTLESLPPRQLRNGFIEVIKHALIADKELFDYLEKNLNAILDRQIDLTDIITKNVLIKKQVIETDLHESNLRRILNFGHTFGHALEKNSDYSILHGEAVAQGIIFESKLSTQLAGLPIASFERIQKMIEIVYPDIEYTTISTQIVDTMKLDKKAVGNAPRFVLLKEIGITHPFGGDFCKTVEPGFMRNAG